MTMATQSRRNRVSRHHRAILRTAVSISVASCGGNPSGPPDTHNATSMDAGALNPDTSANPGAPTPDASANPDAPIPDASANPGAPTPDASANQDAASVPPVSCDSLSKIVGMWQDISPAAFYMPVNLETLAVAVNPMDETVFAAAGNVTNGSSCPAGTTCPSVGTGIFKSSDCGATWSRVSSTNPGSDSANLLTGDPWALLIDPVDPSVMYMDNGYGNSPTIYKSTNGGVDWTALNPDPAKAVGAPYPFVQAIAMDPYDHEHLAVTFHANCAAPYNALCLSESTNGGDTWIEFNGPSSIPGWTITGWIEGASVSILGPTQYVFVSGAGIWYTGDAGATWTQVAAQSLQSSYAGGTHIVPDGTLYIGGGSDVLFSPPAPMSTPPFAIGSGKPSVMMLAHSPGVSVITDDGVSLFASQTGGATAQAFWTAPLSNPTAWQQMPDSICGPTLGSFDNEACRGSNEMAYDSVHHVIYSANWHAGLWRLVTR